jgi:hypothetical protein
VCLADLLDEHGDFLAVDNELSVLGRHVALESAVRRVVLEHVDHVIGLNEWIYAQELGQRRSTATRSTLTVDRNDLNAFLDGTS